jgi:hypothetical protein
LINHDVWNKAKQSVRSWGWLQTVPTSRLAVSRAFTSLSRVATFNIPEWSSAEGALLEPDDFQQPCQLGILSGDQGAELVCRQKRRTGADAKANFLEFRGPPLITCFSVDRLDLMQCRVAGPTRALVAEVLQS